MTKTKHSAFTELPIVDISDLFSSNLSNRKNAAKNLDSAVREAGFLYIKGHQVSSELITNLKLVVKAYFSQSIDTKMSDYIGLSNNHTGYVPQGEEQFYSEDTETSDTEHKVDLKEGYDIGPNSPSLMQRFEPSASTQWPDNESFKAAVSEYYQAMLSLSRILFNGFALALQLPEDTFTQHLTQPPSQLRLLHYFDNPNAKASDSGIGAHTDYEFFTILLPTSPGLQVVNGAGEWINVPLIDDCFVMNIGDMMELVSNGEYVATSHRVRAVREERYAFPFFSSLDYDTVVAPIESLIKDKKKSQYKTLVCGDHLLAQTMQTFDYLKKRELSGDIALPDSARPLSSFGQAPSVAD